MKKDGGARARAGEGVDEMETADGNGGPASGGAATAVAPAQLAARDPRDTRPERDEVLAGLRPPSYTVRLANFSGPLDLLLYLIQRDEIEIFDIPIARLTEKYLAEIRLMELLDLQVAGEFLVMAATLLRIKARMLLPKQESDEAVEEDDPRDELVQRLLEYREFKRAAAELDAREEWRRNLYGRSLPPGETIVEEELLRNVTLFDLVSIYRQVLDRTPRLDSFEVILDEITLEDRIAEILARLDESGRVGFSDLLDEEARRIQIVITLIALLELARLGKISIVQSALFGPIWLERRAADVA